MTIVTSPPGSASPATRRRARFLDRPARNTLLATASLMIIAVIALFVTGSGGSTAVSFNLSSYSIQGHDIVVYGSVTDGAHNAVGGAQVEVYRVVGGDVRILQKVRTTPDGLYRVVLGPHRRIVHVKVSRELHGTHYQGSTRIRVRHGRAYKVSAELLRRGSVFFLPLFNY